MRVLIYSAHRYPARTEIGAGFNPTDATSGAASMVHDWLAKGLAELGHKVFYLLKEGTSVPPPPGVEFVSAPVPDVDVSHNLDLGSRPWVTTIHSFRPQSVPAPENWIFVSRTLAQSLGRSRFVLNGLDPADYVYTEKKEEYYLFIGSMNKQREKGLAIALQLSRDAGFPLVVAGTASDTLTIQTVAEMCRNAGASYVGDVRGARKTELIAGAKAVLFPTQVPEAFGLVIAEALVSGTPVITSDHGACPELMSQEVGFVCKDPSDYLRAIDRIGEISPQACRAKAITDFHYKRMTLDYIREYEAEISSGPGA
jgi:glycosyltransferase involved in cell wall biosynthesis